MSYLLDTNICSAHLKGDRTVFNRSIQHTGRLFVPTIVVGELYTWINRAKTKSICRETLVYLLSELQMLELDLDVARRFGQIRAVLLDSGRPVPEVDLVIGATALVHDLTLVTDNVQDFAAIPGLRVENWLSS